MTPTGTSGPDDSSRAPSSSPAAGSLGASNIVSRVMSSLGSLRLVPRRDSCGTQLAFADHQSGGGSATAGRAGATYLAWRGQEAPYSRARKCVRRSDNTPGWRYYWGVFGVTSNGLVS